MKPKRDMVKIINDNLKNLVDIVERVFVLGSVKINDLPYDIQIYSIDELLKYSKDDMIDFFESKQIKLEQFGPVKFIEFYAYYAIKFILGKIKGMGYKTISEINQHDQINDMITILWKYMYIYPCLVEMGKNYPDYIDEIEDLEITNSAIIREFEQFLENN